MSCMLFSFSKRFKIPPTNHQLAANTIDQPAMNDMRTSPFNRLPAELRDIIWEFTLYEPTGSQIWTEPGLLRTCKAIRSETELMFYAINDFSHSIHEEYRSNSLRKWLEVKSGKRTHLIRSLTIHVGMPSLDSKHEARHAEEADAKALRWTAFLMDIMDAIRDFTLNGQALADRAQFTLNGACDSHSTQEIDKMPEEEHDRYKGAKFLILCLIHGGAQTVDAMEAKNVVELITEMDEEVGQQRAVAMAARLGSWRRLCAEGQAKEFNGS